MELCKRNASLVWNVFGLLSCTGFQKGLTGAAAPKLGCVSAGSWGRWSTGPCCFHRVCSETLAGGQGNFRATGGLKNHVCVAGWVVRSGFARWKTVQRTMLRLRWLLMVVCPSSPRLEFEVQVSAPTSSSRLCLGKRRSASCWLQQGSRSRTSRQ